VPGGAEAVEQQPGGQRVEPEIGGDLRRGRLTRGQAGGDAGADGGDHRTRKRHPAPGVRRGDRDKAGAERQPFGGVGPAQRKPHLTEFST